MDLQHPSGLARVTVHQVSFNKRATIGAVFLALYAFSGQWCFDTMGEPLAAAKAEIEARELAKNATLNI